jgi:hypothetical protein
VTHIDSPGVLLTNLKLYEEYGVPNVFLLYAGDAPYDISYRNFCSPITMIGIGRVYVSLKEAYVVDVKLINLNLAGPCVLHGSNLVLNNVTSDANLIVFNDEPTRACIITDCKMKSMTIQGFATTLRSEGDIRVDHRGGFVPVINHADDTTFDGLRNELQAREPARFIAPFPIRITAKAVRPRLLNSGILVSRIARPFIPILDAASMKNIKWRDGAVYVFFSGHFILKSSLFIDASNVTILGVGSVTIEVTSLSVSGSHVKFYNMTIECTGDRVTMSGDNIEMFDITIRSSGAKGLELNGRENYLENVSIVGGKIGLYVGKKAVKTTAINSHLSKQSEGAVKWLGDDGVNASCILLVNHHMEKAYVVNTRMHHIKCLYVQLRADVITVLDTRKGETGIENMVIDASNAGDYWNRVNHELIGSSIQTGLRIAWMREVVHKNLEF